MLARTHVTLFDCTKQVVGDDLDPMNYYLDVQPSSWCYTWWIGLAGFAIYFVFLPLALLRSLRRGDPADEKFTESFAWATIKYTATRQWFEVAFIWYKVAEVSMFSKSDHTCTQCTERFAILSF